MSIFLEQPKTPEQIRHKILNKRDKIPTYEECLQDLQDRWGNHSNEIYVQKIKEDMQNYTDNMDFHDCVCMTDFWFLLYNSENYCKWMEKQAEELARVL